MAGTEKVPEPSHPDGEHREVFFQHSLGLSPVLFSACSPEALARPVLGGSDGQEAPRSHGVHRSQLLPGVHSQELQTQGRRWHHREDRLEGEAQER